MVEDQPLGCMHTHADEGGGVWGLVFVRFRWRWGKLINVLQALREDAGSRYGQEEPINLFKTFTHSEVEVSRGLVSGFPFREVCDLKSQV